MWRQSWSFVHVYHTKWNIFKTKQESKNLSIKEFTLQFSMIIQIRVKNNNVNFLVICSLILKTQPRGQKTGNSIVFPKHQQKVLKKLRECTVGTTWLWHKEKGEKFPTSYSTFSRFLSYSIIFSKELFGPLQVRKEIQWHLPNQSWW
jgi:hypothetical protein